MFLDLTHPFGISHPSPWQHPSESSTLSPGQWECIGFINLYLVLLKFFILPNWLPSPENMLLSRFLKHIQVD